jgi:two-component system, chemotaxis family, protein-glutamate methylesterase/glutaminase
MSGRGARDLVVIGASAGGVIPLAQLCAALPADFPAAIVVAMHLATKARSHLASVLQRSTPLEVVTASDGAALRGGTVFVAPPDHHTVIREGVIGLNHGPRENRHRPSIDALFRSAAAARGPAVVGVVLSGALDDGAAGLHCIERAGGVTVVQDPQEAQFPSMPESALRAVAAQHVLSVRAMPALLDGLVRAPLSAGPVLEEHAVEESRAASGFVCPDCGGSLSEIQEGRLIRYECTIGHRYSPITLDAASDEATEAALWSALRALRESAAVDRRLVELAASGRAVTAGASYASNAADKEQQADRIEALLFDALRARRAKV